MNTKLWYLHPAETFTEALPLGNGSMGAMVYGGVPNEKISLNLDTLWSGTGPKEEKPVASENLALVRRMIFDGQYYEAQEYIRQNMLGFYNESYMPLADLMYTYEKLGPISGYKRSLDLENAVLKTSFSANGTDYHSEMFFSHPDHLLAARITTEKKGALQLTVSLTSKLHFAVSRCEGGLQIIGNAPSAVQPNYIPSKNPIIYDENNPGMPFCGLLHIKSDGISSIREQRLTVQDACFVELYFTAADGYVAYGKELDFSHAHCITKCDDTLRHAERDSFETLKRRHIEDYRSVDKGVRLELGEGDQQSEQLPTDLRLRQFCHEQNDLNLCSLLFHYGRYLLIASSRKGAQPANLQGVWNDSARPVWSSNWTVNINTQMNYWPTGVCNLTDCFEPLMHLLQDLSNAGRTTAKLQYHCGGWAANHNVDLWRQTGPVDGLPKYAYWPMSGVWLCTQMFDIYYFTQDMAYLRRLYPILRSAVQFCVDWLVLRPDGLYHTCPSTSPENEFLDEKGRVCGVSESCTLDIGLIRELFSQFIKANKLLDQNDTLTSAVMKRLTRLPPAYIGKNGMLLEWSKDFTPCDKGHRHFSPLFILFPGTEVDPLKNPVLAKACQGLLEDRVENNSGKIGWSCAWLINLCARLGDGNRAMQSLQDLLTHSLYPNLFDLHPPLGENDGEREVFQIDGNLGAASGIANMLLWSAEGEMRLLPALPDQWRQGQIKGLLARGNIRVDIYWKAGQVTAASFLSPVAQTVTVHFKPNGEHMVLKLAENKTMTITL